MSFRLDSRSNAFRASSECLPYLVAMPSVLHANALRYMVQISCTHHPDRARCAWRLSAYYRHPGYVNVYRVVLLRVNMAFLSCPVHYKLQITVFLMRTSCTMRYESLYLYIIYYI